MEKGAKKTCAKNIISAYDEYEKQLMREIQGLEGKTSGDPGMLPIAPSNQHSEDNILPTTVSEAVETLFEFIERDV